MRPDRDELVAQLADAHRAGDEACFTESLEALTRVCGRARDDGVKSLAEELQRALRECSTDPAVSRLIQVDVPDAQTRLHHVLTLTNDAAHRTLGHIEDCMPLAARIRDGADRLRPLAKEAALAEYIEQSRRDAESISAHLTEVLLAQSFQDLTGQIITRLITFIGDIEKALEILVRLGDVRSADDLPRQLLEELRARRDRRNANGFGPQIPCRDGTGLETEAKDVDQLISELGI